MGISGPIPREDKGAILEMGLMLGKIVHPAKWVDELVARAEAARLEGI